MLELEFWFNNKQTKATPGYKRCTQQLHITSLTKLAVITVKSFLTDKHQGRFLVFNSSPSSCRWEILFLLVWSWTWNKVEIKKRIEVRNIIDKYMYQSYSWLVASQLWNRILGILFERGSFGKDDYTKKKGKTLGKKCMQLQIKRN